MLRTKEVPQTAEQTRNPVATGRYVHFLIDHLNPHEYDGVDVYRRSGNDLGTKTLVISDVAIQGRTIESYFDSSNKWFPQSKLKRVLEPLQNTELVKAAIHFSTDSDHAFSLEFSPIAPDSAENVVVRSDDPNQEDVLYPLTDMVLKEMGERREPAFDHTYITHDLAKYAMATTRNGDFVTFHELTYPFLTWREGIRYLSVNLKDIGHCEYGDLPRQVLTGRHLGELKPDLTVFPVDGFPGPDYPAYFFVNGDTVGFERRRGLSTYYDYPIEAVKADVPTWIPSQYYSEAHRKLAARLKAERDNERVRKEGEEQVIFERKVMAALEKPNK